MPALHSVAIRCESSAFLNGFYFQAARDIFGTFGSTTPSSRLTALGCGEEFAACDEPRDILGWGSEQNGVCLGNMSECGGVALFHVGKTSNRLLYNRHALPKGVSGRNIGRISLLPIFLRVIEKA